MTDTQTPNDHITLSRLNSLGIQKNQSRNWLRNDELMILGGKSFKKQTNQTTKKEGNYH